MRKLYLFCATSILFLTACSFSVDSIKPTVVNSIKSALNTKTKIQTALIPNGDTSLIVDGKTYTVKKETMDSARKLLETNNELQQILVDLVGETVTDENLALLAHYAEKLGLSLEQLITALQ